MKGTKILFLACVLFAFEALFIPRLYAAAPRLNEIDQTDLDNVTKELSANFVHTTVSDAASLGDIWGIELGIVGGITQTPKLEALVKEVDPNTKVSYLPHGGLMGIIGVPFGLSGEFTFIPKKTFSDVTVENKSMAIKWSFGEFVLPNPILDMALRVHYSKSDLSYKQTINNSTTSNQNVESTVKFDSKTWGANLSFSADLIFVSPFAGFGFVKSDSDVEVVAQTGATIFSQTLNLSNTQKATSSNSSAHLFAGVQFNLFLLHLSAEISRVFSTTSYTGKLSFYF